MIPNPYSGKFIAFEGLDGAGKSKQCENTYQWLSSAEIRGLGVTPVKTKEPNRNYLLGQKIYEELNKEHGLYVTNPFGFQRWYACNSKEHLRQRVIPWLKTGCVVLCDRYRPSLCYGAKNLDDIRELMRINESIVGEDFIWPDLIFILCASPEVCIARKKSRGAALDGHEKIEVQKRVFGNYQHFANHYPNCVVLNTEYPEKAVFTLIKEKVKKNLGINNS